MLALAHNDIDWPYCEAARHMRSITKIPSSNVEWDNFQFHRRLEEPGPDGATVSTESDNAWYIKCSIILCSKVDSIKACMANLQTREGIPPMHSAYGYVSFTLNSWASCRPQSRITGWFIFEQLGYLAHWNRYSKCFQDYIQEILEARASGHQL